MTFIRFYSPKLEIVCQYLAKWKTTSHYKIYPVHMAVLLISTISHDLPEVITLYFYIGCPPDFVFILNSFQDRGTSVRDFGEHPNFSTLVTNHLHLMLG